MEKKCKKAKWLSGEDLQTWLGLRFVPFPGLTSSGDQVLGKCSLPRWCGVSYHLPHPSRLVSWVHIGSTVSGVLCVSSGEQISGFDPPGRCQPFRIPGRPSNWEPVTVWWRMPISGAEISPCLLVLSIVCLPASLPLVTGGGACMQQASSPLVFAQSFVL